MCSEIELEIEEPAETAGAEQERVGPQSTLLTIGKDLIQYTDRSGRGVVLDFERRRRLTIEEASGVFVDDSLFAEVGMRHVELPNREHIRRVMEAGGADGSFFAPVMVEHQLSLRNPKRTATIAVRGADLEEEPPGGLRALFQRQTPTKARADIVARVADEEVVYRAGARRLLAHAREGFDAPSNGFVQFLRYRFGGHPLILAEVERLSFIPRALSLYALSPAPFDRGAVTVKPSSPRRGSDELPETTGLRQVVDLDDAQPGDSVLVGSCATSDRSPVALTAERMAAALSLVRSGDALEGALRFFELTLEVGVALPPEMAAALRASPDDRVTDLLATLGGVNDAASARLALAIHARLRRTLARENPALDAFEAEVRRAMGETEAAKALLTRAIAANPRLVGAYKTLGDVYLANFDGRRAWRCWDIARALCPAHPMLEQPTAFEEMLLAQYPEYFGATSALPGASPARSFTEPGQVQ